ncbi:RrF2 family transcriptional regulator [Phascolarctobacterium sp.]
MNSEFILAVHALVYLNHINATVSSDILAANICTNPGRVRRVMSKLKKAALVTTKEGRTDGGYRFDRDAGTVTLKMVAEALDAKFVTTSWLSGNEDMPCKVASGMAGYMTGLYKHLDNNCKEYLQSITIRDIDRDILQNKPPERTAEL